MFTIDSALQHTCAGFSEQAARGEITAAERDLMTDGAILLAIHLEMLIQDGHAEGQQDWAAARQRVLTGSMS